MTPQIPETTQGSPTIVGEPWIGYIRVSTYYEDKISPDIQRAAIEAWAKRTGRRIVRWIEDLDISGRTFKRKIMLGIKAVEDGDARGIAVWRYSRFGRSRHGNGLNLARLEGVGGRLESATEAADTRTAFGRLQMGMAFKFAEFESDRIGEQWAETRENRLARGLPTTGRKRWGYVWHRRYLDEDNVLHPEWYEPDEELGLVVTDLYERLADGEPMLSACLWLGRNGYLGTRGKPWKQTGLTRYFDSGFPAGWIRHHPDDCPCPPADPDGTASRAGLCPTKVWLPGAQEIIVKEDVWDAYQKARDRAKKKPRSQVAAYPLSGHMRCARCGGDASIGGGATHGAGGVLIRKNGYVFRCSERKESGTCGGVYILRTVAEEAVLKSLAEWAEEIEAEAARLAEETPDDRASTAPATAEDRTARARKVLADRLAEISRELDTQTSLVSRGIIPEDSYVRERDRLTGEQLSTTQQIAELDAQAEQAPTDRAALLPVMRGLLERWDLTPVRTRRDMLREVLHGIWAYPRLILPDGTEQAPYAVPVPVWEEKPTPLGRQWGKAAAQSE
ncbi:recombinase family protein [Streptomyces sp. NPDC094048]|uniref:recombinase family protein n=1 Tax=Streptomyces sp. NPDC094048 TaxID=3155207 RepID=UPI00332F2F80